MIVERLLTQYILTIEHSPPVNFKDGSESLLLAPWWMIIAWIHSGYKGIKVTQFHSEIKASKSIETSQNYFCSIIHFFDNHLCAQYFPNTYTVAKVLLNFKTKYDFKQLCSIVVCLTILFAFFKVYFSSWIVQVLITSA